MDLSGHAPVYLNVTLDTEKKEDHLEPKYRDLGSNAGTNKNGHKTIFWWKWQWRSIPTNSLGCLQSGFKGKTYRLLLKFEKTEKSKNLTVTVGTGKIRECT